ncbi:MAG: hypothetical protein ACC707_03445, partial [Thiohalomonadales bacterium]
MNNTFARPTDQDHQVIVTSEIASVIWGSQAAAIGETVVITVHTRFVGRGSSINLRIQQSNGKQIHNIELPVYGDRVKTEFMIPAGVKTDLICTVTLSTNGSQKDSLPLRIIPERTIDQLRWQPSDVSRETIVNLQAQVTGIAAEDTVLIKIYEYSEQGLHLPLTQLYSQIEQDKIDLDWCFDYPQSTQNIATQIQQQDVNDNYRVPRFYWTVEHDGQTYGEYTTDQADP